MEFQSGWQFLLERKLVNGDPDICPTQFLYYQQRKTKFFIVGF